MYGLIVVGGQKVGGGPVSQGPRGNGKKVISGYFKRAFKPSILHTAQCCVLLGVRSKIQN